MADIGSGSYAVEPMAPVDDGVELLLGSRRDPRFGPVVAVGLGGVYTELLEDFAIGLAPMDAEEAERLLRSLRGAPLLLGARGRPPLDLAAAARAAADPLDPGRSPSRDLRDRGQPPARARAGGDRARRADRPRRAGGRPDRFTRQRTTTKNQGAPNGLQPDRRAAGAAASGPRRSPTEIIAYEEDCERDRGLGPEALAEISAKTIEHGLNAINMPAEWGGAGLSIFDQVIVQEQLGQITNALWDAVWRPANALRACDEEQRARWLEPAIRGERRDCVAVTEADAGSDPTALASVAERDGDDFLLSGEKWFVTVGDVADFLIVLARVMPEDEPTMFLVDKDLPGVAVKRTPAFMHTFVYEHPEFVFDRVRLGPETRARRDRPGL